MYITVNNITYYFDKTVDYKDPKTKDLIWQLIINSPKNSYEYNKLMFILKYYINKKYNNHTYMNNIDKLIFKH
jgi:hypothetical protein